MTGQVPRLASKTKCISALSKIGNGILKYFSDIFPRKQDISCKLSPLETICMQIMFSGKNKNIINLSSAESAPRVVKVKKVP